MQTWVSFVQIRRLDKCLITHPRHNPGQRQQARGHLQINNYRDDKTVSTTVQRNNHEGERTVPRNFTFDLHFWKANLGNARLMFDIKLRIASYSVSISQILSHELDELARLRLFNLSQEITWNQTFLVEENSFDQGWLWRLSLNQTLFSLIILVLTRS